MASVLFVGQLVRTISQPRVPQVIWCHLFFLCFSVCLCLSLCLSVSLSRVSRYHCDSLSKNVQADVVPGTTGVDDSQFCWRSDGYSSFLSHMCGKFGLVQWWVIPSLSSTLARSISIHALRFFLLSLAIMSRDCNLVGMPLIYF